MKTENLPPVVGGPKKEQRLSLQFAKIAQDTSTFRSLDWDRSRFDIEFGLRNGTTYNSFLIKGKKTALVDTSHKKFLNDWIQLLKKEINPCSIDYLIVSHTEPDHSGLIGELLELNPDIEILASKVAIQFLANQVHRPFRSRAIKSGEELDLGENSCSGISHRLEFISAPNLHWPDTIFTFDYGTSILYTCDAFGLHYCSEEVFDIDQQVIYEDFRFYYECLMGPNARSVLQAIKRLEKLPTINIIAVGHGPLLKYHLNSWIEYYQTWSNQKSKGKNYSAICYISQYGFCDQLSQSIAHGVAKTNAQAQLIDLNSSDPQELTALISEAKAVVVPTWPSQPIGDLQNSIGTLLAALSQKQWIGVYEAYGGNDEPIDAIANKLRTLGQKEGFSPLRVKQNPDSNTFQRFEEAGTDLGQLLNRKQNVATAKSIDGELAKAMGRVSGGLYIVTAEQGLGNDRRRGAMVASWVSQASFKPPGLTVAVAKDRAIEALMQVGDRFVINVLREDNYQPILRHFLKRFPPGADRFEGVAILEDHAKGGPVLMDALAFLSCQVQQRLETPDHWIVYGLVEQGNVADTSTKTAVHHRKVGSNY